MRCWCINCSCSIHRMWTAIRNRPDVPSASLQGYVTATVDRRYEMIWRCMMEQSLARPEHLRLARLIVVRPRLTELLATRPRLADMLWRPGIAGAMSGVALGYALATTAQSSSHICLG